MKKRLVILVLIGMLSCMTSGCEKQNGTENHQSETTKSASASSGEYVTTYSDLSYSSESLKENGLEGPYYIDRINLSEESSEEEVALAVFTEDQTTAFTSNRNDNSKFWFEIIKNAEGAPVSVKVSSNAANDWIAAIHFQVIKTDLPAYQLLRRSDGGVHSSDGTIIQSQYEDPEKPIACTKTMNFKCSNQDGDELRNTLEEAGYPTFDKRYQNGTYTISTLKELDSRGKIEQNVLKPEGWVSDKAKSKGNNGFYIKADNYTGRIDINWTLNNIPFTIVINDAKLEKLEDSEDETSYTMSGTAEIQQKSFAMEDIVFRLKDKQSKPFREEYAFKIVKEPELGVMWDYVESWEYIDDTYGTAFLVTVSYTTRNSPTDFSTVQVESLDKIDGTDTMSFMLPAFGGTASWSFKAE